MSDPDPTCETCHGRGWHPEETEESKRAAGDLDFLDSFDYREAFCSCPAGERLRERDGGGNRYGCGGALCTGCARHETASIGVGEARFSCGHVARAESLGAEMLREAEGPCSKCRRGP